MMSQLLPKPCNAEFCCKWAPVVDGVELPQHPYMLAAEGKRAAVPLLLGTNKDEDVSFAAQQLFCKTTSQQLVLSNCLSVSVRSMTLMACPFMADNLSDAEFTSWAKDLYNFSTKQLEELKTIYPPSAYPRTLDYS